MSATVRALCRIIEARPLLSLTDTELQVLRACVAGPAAEPRNAENHPLQAVWGRINQELAARRPRRPLPDVDTGWPMASRHWPTEKALAALREGDQS